MTIRVYNTLTKTKEDFEPVEAGKVGIYLCGPTVYKPSHIGHMVGPLIFDTIKRYLEYNGFDVTLVVNITDVDDKLIAESQSRGITMEAVAEEMTADYLKNLGLLGVNQIDEMPKATDNIDEIITFVSELIEKGHAYDSDGDVFFDVTSDPDYGELSNRSIDDQQGEGGDAASRKRHPSDFALWKSARDGEPSWESPWGNGRPGWHIECSAMSRRILGRSFDIHGGGLDLVFPHHENERAQSNCCHNIPMVKYWMHNGLMRAVSSAGKVGGRSDREQDNNQATVDTKISRSKGAGGLAELIERQGGDRIRFFLLRTHYRSTIVFSEEGIEEAGAALDTFARLFERVERISGKSVYDQPLITSRKEGELGDQSGELLTEVANLRNGFLSKMDDDFNTGGAISDIFDLARAINRFIDQQNLEDSSSRSDDDLLQVTRAATTIRELGQLLGLFVTRPQQASSADDALLDSIMQLVIRLRTRSRENKDYETADFLRDQLTEIGITIEDGKEGSNWRIE